MTDFDKAMERLLPHEGGYSTDRAGLNANQTAFARDWRGSPVWTVCSEDEATAVVQNWRKG